MAKIKCLYTTGRTLSTMPTADHILVVRQCSLPEGSLSLIIHGPARSDGYVLLHIGFYKLF